MRAHKQPCSPQALPPLREVQRGGLHLWLHLCTAVPPYCCTAGTRADAGHGAHGGGQPSRGPAAAPHPPAAALARGVSAGPSEAEWGSVGLGRAVSAGAPTRTPAPVRPRVRVHPRLLAAVGARWRLTWPRPWTICTPGTKSCTLISRPGGGGLQPTNAFVARSSLSHRHTPVWTRTLQAPEEDMNLRG